MDPTLAGTIVTVVGTVIVTVITVKANNKLDQANKAVEAAGNDKIQAEGWDILLNNCREESDRRQKALAQAQREVNLWRGRYERCIREH